MVVTGIVLIWAHNGVLSLMECVAWLFAFGAIARVIAIPAGMDCIA